MLEIAKEWAILFPLSILVADMEASGIVTVFTIFYFSLSFKHNAGWMIFVRRLNRDRWRCL